MIIALLVMVLLSMFVAASLSRVTNDAVITGNAYSHTAAFYAAQASLEKMSRDFSQVFVAKTAITSEDVDAIEADAPTIPGYSFVQDLVQLNAGQPPVTSTIPEGPYAGLVSLRDSWRLDTTARAADARNTDVKLTRTFYNHLVPIFQFAAFYDGDMEFFPGGTMNIAGRVHTNGNLYLNGADLHFGSAVTSAGEIVHDVARNGSSPFYSGDHVYVTNGSGSEKLVTKGSVTDGPDTKHNDSDVPDGTTNGTWETFRTQFNDNLIAHAPKLQLPIQVNGGDPVEVIKRGRSADSNVIAASRYYNKACIRVTLDDSQSRLPGGTGGRRLDGDANGLGGLTSATNRGYTPRVMKDGYQATRINGFRFFTGASYAGSSYYTSANPRQTWIKVELVSSNNADPGHPTTTDITEDFLSLGMTEKVTLPGSSGNVTFGDDRAILKMQRFTIPGAPLRVSSTTLFAAGQGTASPTVKSSKNVYTYDTAGSMPFSCVAYNSTTPSSSNYYLTGEDTNVLSPSTKKVKLNASSAIYQLVPVPIEMFDTREGLFHDSVGLTGSPTQASMDTQWTSLYVTNGLIPVRGVMSLIDVDVANLKRYVDGTWNSAFQNGLSSSDVPNADGRGLILYVSDRRGDADYDGVYDMENLFVTAPSSTETGAAQRGEDLSGANNPGEVQLTPDGQVQVDYTWESAPYSTSVESDWAAVSDHQYFRRAVRLINGTTLPGTSTKGFTLASENGVYILGNYNATGVSNSSGLSTPAQYQGTSVPASVVADAVTILSRSWNDGKSFRRPLDYYTSDGTYDRYVPSGYDTTVRAALLMGLSKSSSVTSPNQGGIANSSNPSANTQNLNGGVHNFPRFLEYWNTRCSYCGSMIGLFYSRVSNGTYKFGGGHVYSAPERNWTFDTNFLIPSQLPPGTPFLQYVQLTGFRESFT